MVLDRGDIALFLNEVIGFDEVEYDSFSWDVQFMLPGSVEWQLMLNKYIGNE